jgi:O-antigen ligase
MAPADAAFTQRPPDGRFPDGRAPDGRSPDGRTSVSRAPGGRPPVSLGPLLALAIALPALLAWNVPPSATFYNQAAALLVWGLAIAVLARWLPPRDLIYRAGLNLVLGALMLLGLAALVAPTWAALPWGLALAAAGVIAATGLAAAAGAAASQARNTVTVFGALALGLIVAGVGNAIVSYVQVFAPSAADGALIAATAIEGRAAGNLRQPNQLATLMLWTLLAAAWLADQRLRRIADAQAYAPTLVDTRPRGALTPATPRWHRRPEIQVAAALFVAQLVFLGVIVLTGSRTGALGVLLVAGWAALDRRLAGSVRWVLALAPVVLMLLWWAMLSATPVSPVLERGMDRPLAASTDPRLAVWRNTVALIAAHPWVGVGFGEFNFAWTLTPFVERPRAFFDHSHNLVLQLAAELGVPLALAVLALLGGALWKAGRAAWRTEGEVGIALRAAFVMLLAIVLHSLTEYPLWYAHLLLPTAFLLGLCVAGHEKRSTLQRAFLGDHRPVRTLLMGAMTLVVVTAAAVWDYQRVVVIFAPRADAPPLAERIADGRRSWFFSHHADYAAVTTAERPSMVMPAFDRAAHHLLDARLLMAWSRAMEETNQTDRARHLAQRLAEFRHPQAAEFFAVCARFSEADIAAASEPPRPQPQPVPRPPAAPTPPLVPVVGDAGGVAPNGPAGPATASPAPAGPTGATPVVAGTAASALDPTALPPTPAVVPPATLPKGPAPPPDPAFTPPPPVAVPFQCLRPMRALTYLDFR